MEAGERRIEGRWRPVCARCLRGGAAGATLTLDVVSDLHVEGWEGYIGALLGQAPHEVDWVGSWAPARPADALVVAGDVSNGGLCTVEVLLAAARRWPQVLWVDGNHEHYGTREAGTTVEERLGEMEAALDLAGARNVHRLTPQAPWDHPWSGIRVVGHNGWYSLDAEVGVPPATQEMLWRRVSADPEEIGFGGRGAAGRARAAAAALAGAVAEAGREEAVAGTVVVTHTVPRGGPEWQGPYGEPTHPGYRLNGAYVSRPMETVDTSRVAAWIYGHSHARVTHRTWSTLWICHPRGWPREHRDAAYTARRIEVDAEGARVVEPPPGEARRAREAAEAAQARALLRRMDREQGQRGRRR